MTPPFATVGGFVLTLKHIQKKKMNKTQFEYYEKFCLEKKKTC